jgi:hypothetical protein
MKSTERALSYDVAALLKHLVKRLRKKDGRENWQRGTTSEERGFVDGRTA